MPRLDLPLAELWELREELPEPEGLDAFWQQTLADADAVPLDVRVEPVSSVLTTVTTYDVTFAGFGGAVVLLGALATLRPGRPTTRVLAALTVVLHAVEMFWFVTPALRDRFVIRMSDVFAAVAVGCLGLALRPLVRRLVPLASPRRRRSAAA